MVTGCSVILVKWAGSNFWLTSPTFTGIKVWFFLLTQAYLHADQFLSFGLWVSERSCELPWYALKVCYKNICPLYHNHMDGPQYLGVWRVCRKWEGANGHIFGYVLGSWPVRQSDDDTKELSYSSFDIVKLMMHTELSVITISVP